jgi:Cys-tRNA(Pro)/Cys-tRNA(Cys) deacylase
MSKKNKKNQLKKTLAEQILDKAKISYESIFFEQDEAGVIDRVGIDEHTIYKTLAFTGDKTGPVIAVIPLDWQVSYKKLAAASGNKKTVLIPLKDLVKTTGYVHGANNPVGICQTKRFPIYFENEALRAREIWVSAGELGRSIKLNVETLAEFVHGKFADLCEHE